jgi:hypothetical protein
LSSATELLFELLLAFGLAMAVFLSLAALRYAFSKTWPMVAVAAAGAVAFLVAFLVSYSAEIGEMIPRAIDGTLHPFRVSKTESRALVLLTAALAFAVVELLCFNFRALIEYAVRRVRETWPSGLLGALGVAVVLIALIPALLMLVGKLESRLDFGGSGGIMEVASYPLPGSPVGMALVSSSEGFIGLEDGRVAHFRLPENGGDLDLQIVAEGFQSLRGLGYGDGVLYIAESGPFICEEDLRSCEITSVVDRPEKELAGLKNSNGRIVAYDVGTDGQLSNERDIISGLPTASFRHGVNLAKPGPDGRLYVSIGNLDDGLIEEIEVVETVDHPHLDYLGTVLSMNPDGSDVEVYVSGVRNLYDLSFDEDGNIYAVDNDGHSARSLHREEVLALREGGNYGFPYAGSFDREGRTDYALWFADPLDGSSGAEWAPLVGLRPGLLIGSYGRLDYLAFERRGSEWIVGGEENLLQLLELEGVPTALEATGDGRLLAAMYGAYFSGEDELIVYEFDPDVFPPVD